MLQIKLNSDTDLVAAIQAKLKTNGGFCPCSLIKNEDTKCMCKQFREQEIPGECHCGLFVKVEV